MIFTIVSADKLSMSMFSDFLQSTHLQTPKVVLLDVSCLYSSKVQEAMINDQLKITPDANILVRYKTKKGTKIPDGVSDNVLYLSDYVVSFDLYSMHPVVIKNRGDFVQPILEDWERQIEKLNK